MNRLLFRFNYHFMTRTREADNNNIINDAYQPPAKKNKVEQGLSQVPKINEHYYLRENPKRAKRLIEADGEPAAKKLKKEGKIVINDVANVWDIVPIDVFARVLCCAVYRSQKVQQSLLFYSLVCKQWMGLISKNYAFNQNLVACLQEQGDFLNVLKMARSISLSPAFFQVKEKDFDSQKALALNSIRSLLSIRDVLLAPIVSSHPRCTRAIKLTLEGKGVKEADLNRLKSHFFDILTRLYQTEGGYVLYIPYLMSVMLPKLSNDAKGQVASYLLKKFQEKDDLSFRESVELNPYDYFEAFNCMMSDKDVELKCKGTLLMGCLHYRSFGLISLKAGQVFIDGFHDQSFKDHIVKVIDNPVCSGAVLSFLVSASSLLFVEISSEEVTDFFKRNCEALRDLLDCLSRCGDSADLLAYALLLNLLTLPFSAVEDRDELAEVYYGFFTDVDHELKQAFSEAIIKSINLVRNSQRKEHLEAMLSSLLLPLKGPEKLLADINKACNLEIKKL